MSIHKLSPEDLYKHCELGDFTFQTTNELKVLEHPFLWRYTVNVMVNNTGAQGIPVVYEDNPTYNNLIGRIEHISQMGTLTTDFTYIKPGSLHKANGGYLLVDAMRLLTQPFSWEGLKRALQNRNLKVEALGDMYGLLSTVHCNPNPSISTSK